MKLSASTLALSFLVLSIGLTACSDDDNAVAGNSSPTLLAIPADISLNPSAQQKLASTDVERARRIFDQLKELKNVDNQILISKDESSTEKDERLRAYDDLKPEVRKAVDELKMKCKLVETGNKNHAISDAKTGDLTISNWSLEVQDCDAKLKSERAEETRFLIAEKTDVRASYDVLTTLDIKSFSEFGSSPLFTALPYKRFEATGNTRGRFKYNYTLVDGEMADADQTSYVESSATASAVLRDSRAFTINFKMQSLAKSDKTSVRTAKMVYSMELDLAGDSIFLGIEYLESKSGSLEVSKAMLGSKELTSEELKILGVEEMMSLTALNNE